MIALGVFCRRHLTITVTPSLPYRLFFLKRETPRKGDYVLFQHRSKYLEGTNLFVKQVVCVEGEILEIRERNYFCDNRYLGSAKEYTLKGVRRLHLLTGIGWIPPDAMNRLLDTERLEPFVFHGTIPVGFLFLMAPHKDSYDSRYFGFIKREEILAVANPLF